MRQSSFSPSWLRPPPTCCSWPSSNINVVTAADLPGKLGPIPLDRDANAITGRMSSRYQR